MSAAKSDAPLRLEWRSPEELAENPRNWRTHPEAQVAALGDELILDPFLGSGTTLIAAHRLGRRCFGCEIEPRYADVILRRAEAEGLECRKES
jgi:adenine-specific DNA methylase